MQELDDPIPLSALQHAVFCLRQAALIHIERLWEENRFTAEGRVLHEAAHDPGTRKRGGIRRVTALPLACRRLNIAGSRESKEPGIYAWVSESLGNAKGILDRRTLG